MFRCYGTYLLRAKTIIADVVRRQLLQCMLLLLAQGYALCVVLNVVATDDQLTVAQDLGGNSLGVGVRYTCAVLTQTGINLVAL